MATKSKQTLAFSHEFSYQENLLASSLTHSPTLGITLINPRDSTKRVDVVALIDTGGERMLFNEEFLEVLGIPLPEEGEHTCKLSMRGGAIYGVEHDVVIELTEDGEITCQVKAVFAPGITLAILGRATAFEQLKIGLQEKYLKFYLGAES